MNPLKIERNKDGKGMSITWENNKTQHYSSEVLRKLCPCATCREERGEDAHQGITPPKKRSMLNVIKNTAEESLNLEKIWGVGSYAIGLQWKDGHNSGIYTYEYLQQLIRE